MEKYFNDKGEVAVLYSPGYGAGWSTWSTKGKFVQTLLFDRDIVEAVLNEDFELAKKIAQEKCPGFYASGAEDLTIEWMSPGQIFKVDCYDGSESIEYVYVDGEVVGVA